jgi:hypothetical protein
MSFILCSSDLRCEDMPGLYGPYVDAWAILVLLMVMRDITPFCAKLFIVSDCLYSELEGVICGIPF